MFLLYLEKLANIHPDFIPQEVMVNNLIDNFVLHLQTLMFYIYTYQLFSSRSQVILFLPQRPETLIFQCFIFFCLTPLVERRLQQSKNETRSICCLLTDKSKTDFSAKWHCGIGHGPTAPTGESMQQVLAKKFRKKLRGWAQAVSLEKMREHSLRNNATMFSVCLPNRRELQELLHVFCLVGFEILFLISGSHSVLCGLVVTSCWFGG